jgi:divalent metal cation (Fe/Co/Zn/Cd) transporter
MKPLTIGPHYFLQVLYFGNSYKIFRPALGDMMDEHLYDDLVDDIRKVSLTVEGVLATEKCLLSEDQE